MSFTATQVTNSQLACQDKPLASMGTDSCGETLELSAGAAAAASSAQLDGLSSPIGTRDAASEIAIPPDAVPARAAVHAAQSWAAELAQESQRTHCTTVGLISGSRTAAPRCVIEGYARLIADALAALRARRPMLIVRLDSTGKLDSRRAAQNAESTPHIAVSPLGPWSEVAIAVPTGKQSLATLERLSYLLPEWKREFGFVLIDLGPIAEAAGRLIGRHCDSSFVLLGPESCGSYEWLLQHIAWHAKSGSTICGTLVTELE